MRFGVPASSSVSWTPLVLTIGLHLLLVLAWLLQPGVQAPAPTAARETVLVMVAPPLRPAAPTRQIARQPLAKAQPAPQPITPRPSPTPAPAEIPAAAIADAPIESELVQGDPAPSAASGDLLATSRAMAGRVDRELRKGGSPISAEPERKWERFASMVAAARVPATGAVTVDSYTAPDGVVIYRKTVGGRVACYRSGSVGGINASDGHSAGYTTCPPGAQWKRL